MICLLIEIRENLKGQSRAVVESKRFVCGNRCDEAQVYVDRNFRGKQAAKGNCNGVNRG